jgi:transposase
LNDSVSCVIALKMNAAKKGGQKSLALRLLQEGKSVSEIAKTFNVHVATVYRLLDPPDFRTFRKT